MIKISKRVFPIMLLLLAATARSQTPTFTHQDTLRGSITQERVWWDLTSYHLNIKVDPVVKALSGQNTIRYTVLESHQRMQVDLQPPMQITKILQDNHSLSFERDGNAFFIELVEKQNPGDTKEIIVHYEGKPKESKRPPWDGGVSWKKDSNGHDFIVTTCQGDGASLWWPCKDHPYDEPDSMLMSVTVPEHLTDVSNGRLRGVDQNPDHTRTFHWFVSNPINHYGVNINIGDYVHFSDKYKGEKGDLDCDYYVLRNNLEKAKKHFKEAHRMLEALEHWFGPYPFYEDSYKLVEVPYPGMEHQSSVTYGNGYKNGYGGRDVSGSGWGMKFDFIIIHESGHEWFANSITNRDAADMWIHEAFIAYSENLFLNYFYGKQASSEYVIGTRQNIASDRPLIGIYNVNYPGSHDMYYKGANVLHTLRQMVDDDEIWRSILRGLNKEFYHQTVTAEQIEGYLSEHSGMDLSAFFDQYLRDVRIPILEYVIRDDSFRYRWINCVEGFHMPVKVHFGGTEEWLKPTTRWNRKKIDGPLTEFRMDPNFYATSFDVLGKIGQ
jgi:aminopeptidase N